MKLEKKNTPHDHDKYITTQKFYKSTSENFTTGLAQANLANKNDTASLVKKTDFDDKLKSLNKTFTSNETKNILIENKLKELSKKVESISTKGLTKDS